MSKKVVFVMVIVMLAVGGIALTDMNAASAGPKGDGGGISYASLPDEAALYLNNMVFARDTVVLPTEAVRVLLPPGTFADTLILTENGQRVRNYRITPQSSDVYYSQAAFRYGTPTYSGGGASYIVVWEPEHVEAGADTRTIKLEYMMSGASWTPSYDMEIIDYVSVKLAFFAEIQNTSLMLDETTVYLVAGRVDLSNQVDQVERMTMNQAVVGYNEGVELPAMGVGTVDLQHIYPLGQVTAEPNDIVYVNLVNQTLTARRLVVWNAATDLETDVIYKVLNDTEMPLAEGIVRTYQAGLFMGSDFIETTPIGSEGSVTVGSLPDVRVWRTASQEYVPTGDDYYQHTVVLELHNFGEDDLDVIVLDVWDGRAWEFVFEGGLEPIRQQDNILRWEVPLAAGESLTITYTYRTDA